MGLNFGLFKGQEELQYFISNIDWRDVVVTPPVGTYGPAITGIVHQIRLPDKASMVNVKMTMDGSEGHTFKLERVNKDGTAQTMFSGANSGGGTETIKIINYRLIDNFNYTYHLSFQKCPGFLGLTKPVTITYELLEVGK